MTSVSFFLRFSLVYLIFSHFSFRVCNSSSSTIKSLFRIHNCVMGKKFSLLVSVRLLSHLELLHQIFPPMKFKRNWQKNVEFLQDFELITYSTQKKFPSLHMGEKSFSRWNVLQKFLRVMSLHSNFHILARRRFHLIFLKLLPNLSTTCLHTFFEIYKGV